MKIGIRGKLHDRRIYTISPQRRKERKERKNQNLSKNINHRLDRFDRLKLLKSEKTLESDFTKSLFIKSFFKVEN
jgi:DNA-binding PadR family transcriptional regulator